jgi:hypothetical protein
MTNYYEGIANISDLWLSPSQDSSLKEGMDMWIGFSGTSPE